MTREYLTTPPGRLVQGSLYEPQTKNAMGGQLLNKSGEPRENYYIGLAIPKGTEQHWAQTEWGKKIWDTAHLLWAGGKADTPNFAWKITDGDSTVVNTKGVPPCTKEGYAGHWVLNLTNGFAPAIYNANGTEQITTEGYIKAGDFIQACFSVASNNSPQTFPGIFLNVAMVAFVGFGERITLMDAKQAGFGAYPLPAGASLTPKSQGFNPHASVLPAGAVTLPLINDTPAAVPKPSPVATPMPYPVILTPPIPTASVIKKMTEKAGAISYEQFIAQGWTDALLVQHGYMLP